LTLLIAFEYIVFDLVELSKMSASLPFDDPVTVSSSRNPRSLTDNDDEAMQGLRSTIRENGLRQRPPSPGEESGPLLIPDEVCDVIDKIKI
jgi:hypothetical protein